MSQKVSRKSMNEEKDKGQTDGPAKDVKKKMATDKEKQVSDKIDKPEKQADKPEKQMEKKQAEKSEKQPDKSTEKTVDKKEKTIEKRDTQGEKSKDDGAKEEKITKNDLEEVRERPQQNGTAIVRNGVTDVANGTVSGGDSDDDDVTLVIDDEPDQDEMFPELTYDDTSDTEGFELPTDSAPSRSLTRRSQVKATRTPETPRPASEKQTDKDSDADPKDSKVLKLKEDAPSSDRKLRSSDSPKPQEVKKSQEAIKKSQEPATGKESSEKEQEKAEPEVTKEGENSEQEPKVQTVVTESKEESVVKVIEVIEEDKKNDKVVEKKQEEIVDLEVVVEVEPDVEEEKQEPRKLDTNYSKSRVKVSPYRRSSRIADQTASSILANYTGNNTTMEMDITETSFTSELEAEGEGSPPPEDSSYLRGLRTIRARNSYKKLGQLPLMNLANRSARSLGNTSGCESRPTAPVVGRKRRPEADRDLFEQHQHQYQSQTQSHEVGVGCKRMRLLERIAHPFRRNLPHANPLAAPDIVGINTDLPLTAPVVSADTFDPETLKAAPLLAPSALPPAPSEPLATPLRSHPHTHADSKRCAIV